MSTCNWRFSPVKWPQVQLSHIHHLPSKHSFVNMFTHVCVWPHWPSATAGQLQEPPLVCLTHSGVCHWPLTRGGCRGQEPVGADWLSASTLQDSCAGAVAPAVLEEAHQFGLTRNSHMSFAFDDAKVREKYEWTTGKAQLYIVHFTVMLHQSFLMA